MPDDGGVSEKLAAAHKVLAGAHNFQSKMGGPLHKSASYSMPHQARTGAAPSYGSKPDLVGDTLGADLKAKADNVGNYIKNTPQ